MRGAIGVWILCASGCGIATTAIDAAPAPVDAAAPADAGPDRDASGTCAHHVPDLDAGDPPFGTLVGRSFAGFELEDCDGITHDFYDENYCRPSTRLTVILFDMGWCVPSRNESAMLQSVVLAPYGPRGVRVVQVLIENDDARTPDRGFCQSWASRFGLSVRPDANGVGTLELIDPAQLTNIYVPESTVPEALIIDSEGVIRFHGTILAGDLTILTQELDALLASP